MSMLLTAVGYSAISIYVYGNTPYVGKADAAIVLGAAAWGNQPSPVFRERINHGINLYNSGNIRSLIFTGGKGESDEPAESVVAKRYAIANGVPEANILTETESRTTWQNLYYAKQVAVAHQLKRVLIVSDPLHLKRAVLMAQDLGMDAYPSPTPTTRYRSLKSKLQFLARETYFYFVYLLFGI
ncbi:MAG: YdcF family protein [Coleofasciculus sp. S288]|nr:YdcF family protein [Coleofasciculus sp. S288]